MGWAHCGKDSKGRDMGYAIEATCDHPECDKEIDRGLDFACGGMHGEDEVSCENYFCNLHRSHIIEDNLYHGGLARVCVACYRAWERSNA